MNDDQAGMAKVRDGGSSPAARGGAGTYIEGQLGAYYLLQMLAGSEARGLPNARIEKVQLQGKDDGYELDDLIVHGVSHKGSSILEIQSKRTITFAPSDSIFKNVCKQIVRSNPAPIPTDRHLLAVATQRPNTATLGPYQDLLEWARKAESGRSLFARLGLKGVANDKMRGFVNTFRKHLVEFDVADEDEAIWNYLRRFQILVFDFESGASQAEAHALTLASQVLAPEDLGRAAALWRNLVEISIELGKAGGSINRQQLSDKLQELGYHLAGDRHFAPAREKLAEMSRHALANIRSTVGRVSIPRHSALAGVDKARDAHRFVVITGNPGVGKSAVLRHFAERQGREAHVIVLDPDRTPGGGWSALARDLGVLGSAKDFFGDLAASGGGIVFIDGLEMFTSTERRCTVNDLLREIAQIQGFSVVVSRRANVSIEDISWVAEDAIEKLGEPCQVVVGELDDDEAATLSDASPELRALLSPGHPAARIARNLYRLTRLLEIPGSADIRTEAALASRWWESGDNANSTDVGEAQRVLARLAEAALAGRDLIEDTNDTTSRTHLLRRQTLKEPKRDHLGFYHDVLRDWAIGAWLNEDIARLDDVDLAVAPSPRVARGVEFAGRFALERDPSGSGWLTLLETLSRPGAHDAWRRHALMAIARSELALEHLEGCREALLDGGGALLVELCTAIVATETKSDADALAELRAKGVQLPVEAPALLRVATTSSAAAVLVWCVANAKVIPLQAIGAIVKLVEVQVFTTLRIPELGQATAKVLFEWLMRLDLREQRLAFRPEDQAPQTTIEDLRNMALALAAHAPEEAKAYLTAAAAEHDPDKVNAIRRFSNILARIAPVELAALVEATLIEQTRDHRSSSDSTRRAFGFADDYYMPASPAQPPFLDLLDADPAVGLGLIRKLVDCAVEFYSEGRKTEEDGFTVVFGGGSRFFPWAVTYSWSRPMGTRDCSVASGLMALEGWSQERLDKGEDVNAVLRDILGPEGGCAAYLQIAVDVLLSHWPATRDALVPFVANPALLAKERRFLRSEPLRDGPEPSGRIKLADLENRPSRGTLLEHLKHLIPSYCADDDAGQRARSLLTTAVAEIGPYGRDANYGDPAFMGAHALNMLDRANWIEVEGRVLYVPPPAEAEHLERNEPYAQQLASSSSLEVKTSEAIGDPSKGSAELAREAVDFAVGESHDAFADDDLDAGELRATRVIATAMLVSRDGDDALLDEHEDWVRTVIAKALEEEAMSQHSTDRIDWNRPALGLCALIHLWRRRRLSADRDALLRACARSDCAAATAIKAARADIEEIEPRILKAAIRIAFNSCHRLWLRNDQDAHAREAFDKEKAARVEKAVSTEIAWLDGGHEPDWPELHEETPRLSRPRRVAESTTSRPHRSEKAAILVDHQGLALWIRLLDVSALTDWYGEIVDAYAAWSARLNGLGYSIDAEFNQKPHEWNLRFYGLIASAMMDATQDRFDAFLKPILDLPDQSFCSVAKTLVPVADGRYFDEHERLRDRVCALREQLVERIQNLSDWSHRRRDGGTSIGWGAGPMTAHLLMNFYDPFFGGATTYLTPEMSDRLDPLLETVRPLMPGGPTAFVALCTMNALIVAPSPRHLNFLMFAVETWLDVTNDNRSMWHDLGIGRKVAQWFETAANEDPSLFQQNHPSRMRIDAMLGRLVSLGVSEAHDLERKIEAQSS